MKVFKHIHVLFMAQAAMIAAIYVVITLLQRSVPARLASRNQAV